MKYEQLKKTNSIKHWRCICMHSLSVRKEIEELCKKTPNSSAKFFEVRKDQWEQILNNIEERFTHRTQYTKGLHWSWLRFKEPRQTVSFVGPPFKYLRYLINEGEYIWFIAEDINEKMWVYEGEGKFIFEQIIPELYQLKEYYLASKKYKWFVCENHHEVVCLTGNEIIERLNKFKKENSEEVIQ